MWSTEWVEGTHKDTVNEEDAEIPWSFKKLVKSLEV